MIQTLNSKKRKEVKLLSTEWTNVQILHFLKFKQISNLSELQLSLLHLVNNHSWKTSY